MVTTLLGSARAIGLYELSRRRAAGLTMIERSAYVADTYSLDDRGTPSCR